MFVVSHISLLHIHVSPNPKRISDAVYLSVVLERTARFLTTVDVALEEYNSYLPNSKLLGVKLVSIVSG